jgi:hypothetical protein
MINTITPNQTVTTIRLIQIFLFLSLSEDENLKIPLGKNGILFSCHIILRSLKFINLSGKNQQIINPKVIKINTMVIIVKLINVIIGIFLENSFKWDKKEE